MTIHSNLDRTTIVKENPFDFLNNQINDVEIEVEEEDHELIISNYKAKKFSFDSSDVTVSNTYKLPKEITKRRVVSPNHHSLNLHSLSELNKKNEKNFITNISHSNIIFQQLLNLISEQDFKFQAIENTYQIEDYIKSLDNTPVYLTFNCGIVYIPNKSKFI